MKTMGKKLLLSIAFVLAVIIGAGAQEYVATPVAISKEKVKLDGKIYYSHVVLEKQTLYGISKAYDVSIEDIYAANESIQLRESGLKKNSIILIPINDKSNGKKGKKNKEETTVTPTQVEIEETQKPDEIVIPENETEVQQQIDTEVVESVPSDEEIIVEPADTTEAEPILTFEPKSNVGVLMMLPLKAASGRGSSGYMDFYSGALLAARDKGNQGINVNLTIFDVANGVPALSQAEYEAADVVIGPVFHDNTKTVLDRVPADLHVVSPMDAKTEALAADHANMIQSRGSNEMQYADLVAWMSREYNEGEKIVIVYEKGQDKEVSYVEGLLTERGYESTKYSYNILESRSVDVALKARMEAGSNNRVFIVSESEAFVNDAVRNLSLLSRGNAGSYGITLYGSSKIKSFETIEAENLHNVNLHLALPYNVNYDDARVKDFLLKYRAIFKTEPTAYAYQGYDVTYFFISEIAKYGDNWYKWFTEDSASLLQTDFHFGKYSESEESGYINSALRHIVYGPDYSIVQVNL